MVNFSASEPFEPFVTITKKINDVTIPVIPVISSVTPITSNNSPEKDHIISAIDASLQYCFWFKNSSVRPKDSAWVKKTIETICGKYTSAGLPNAKNQIKEALSNSDITLLEERLKSIDEIFSLDFKAYGVLWNNPSLSMEMLLTLPGFSRDIFNKKALFAILSSGQKTGVKSDFDIPADYRIPQVLFHLGVLEYNHFIKQKIQSDVILQEDSIVEIEIRKASIQACRIIAKNNNCTPHDVDFYLFPMKDKCTNKHHLCITTNY